MHRYIREYIKYIKLERRYSPHTIDAYQSDLVQFESFLKEYFRSDQIRWNLVQRRTLRDYLGWLAAQNHTELEIYPGGVHAFDAFPTSIAAQARERMHTFIAQAVQS